MTKSELAGYIFVVLGALSDGKGGLLGGVPNGHLYAALMGKVDIETWQRFVDMLKDNGLATESNYLLKITDKGEVVFGKLQAVFGKL